MDLWFLAFIGLIGYEAYQMYNLQQIHAGDHSAEGQMSRVPFVDFDYTMEQDIEAGHFTSVKRDGVAYIYTLPSGKLYKSYFPYSQSVEPNYQLPPLQQTFVQ
jgi:hypothetical protein